MLISGGASALLPSPVRGVNLEDKAAVTSLLQRAGATIGELNTVRKHLSRLKGGGLARTAAPARVVCLVLSDVVGDDLSTIASGPDRARSHDLRRRARGPAHARRAGGSARSACAGTWRRAPRATCRRPRSPAIRSSGGSSTRVIGSNRWTIEAAAQEARRLGLTPLVLTSYLEGEAREAARALVSILRECVESGTPAATPVCLLAGGETTVTVRGEGAGGRNQELAVAAAEPLALFPKFAVVASMATDGVDGASHAAGGMVDHDTVRRAREAGLPPRQRVPGGQRHHELPGAARRPDRHRPHRHERGRPDPSARR